MAYEFNHYYEIQNVATGKYVNVLGIMRWNRKKW